MALQRVFYLVSTKCKGLKFRIIRLDKAEMRATLEGDTGVPFDTSITQDVLDKLGYTVEIVQVEVNDAPVHSEQTAA